jgi:hypothetical protein
MINKNKKKIIESSLFLNEFFSFKKEPINEENVQWFLKGYKKTIYYKKIKFKLKDFYEFYENVSEWHLVLANYSENDIINLAKSVKKYDKNFDLENRWLKFIEEYVIDRNYQSVDPNIMKILRSLDLVLINKNGAGDGYFISLKNKKIYDFSHENYPQMLHGPENKSFWTYENFIKFIKNNTKDDVNFQEALRRINNNEV